MSDEKVIDIKTKQPCKIEHAPETSITTYLNTWKAHCKNNKTRSIFICAIDEDGGLSWDMRLMNETDAAMFYINLDDMKEFIKSQIYPDDYEVELDE